MTVGHTDNQTSNSDALGVPVYRDGPAHKSAYNTADWRTDCNWWCVSCRQRCSRVVTEHHVRQRLHASTRRGPRDAPGCCDWRLHHQTSFHQPPLPSFSADHLLRTDRHHLVVFLTQVDGHFGPNKSWWVGRKIFPSLPPLLPSPPIPLLFVP